MSLTPAQEFLQTLVQCERFKHLFPEGMPARACLRRQVERQAGARKGTLGPPRMAYCASGECALGYATAQRAAAVGVVLAPCLTCGAAIPKDDPCEACTTTATEKTKPAKGYLPALGAPAQGRIWQPGEVPDVPIGRPPGAPTAGEERAAAVAARVREAAPRVAPSSFEDKKQEVAPEAAESTRIIPGIIPGPAKPAESRERENEMADKICTNCRKTPLRSDNSSGICAACRRAPAAGRAGGSCPAAKKKPVLPPKPKAARRRLTKKLSDAIPNVAGGLAVIPVDQLLELRDAVLAEIRRRKEQAESELATLNSALGEAA